MTKKIFTAAFLTTLAMLTIASVQAFSDEEIILEPAEETPEAKIIESPAIAPKWEEFCETGYENVNETQKKDIFDIFSFVKSERAKKIIGQADGKVLTSISNTVIQSPMKQTKVFVIQN